MVTAGVVTSFATLATVVIAALAARNSATSARDARQAAEDARVTLGAQRDATYLIAGLFPEVDDHDDEAPDRRTEPIPISVTLTVPFDLQDVVIRYLPDNDSPVYRTYDGLSLRRDDVRELMGQLDPRSPYGTYGHVEVECTDAAFETRRLARLDVLCSGRGHLKQNTVHGSQWLILQAERDGISRRFPRV